MYDIPATKKDLFYKFVDAPVGLYGILGARRTGKTILFKQLVEHFNGIYLTGEAIGYMTHVEDVISISKEFYENFESALHSDKKVICLDELTLLSDQYIAKIFSILHNVNFAEQGKLVLYTGSYPDDVERLFMQCGRGHLVNLYDLTFAEYCRWNDIQKPNLSDIISFYRNSCMNNEISVIDYMKSLISCIKSSWSKRNKNSFTDLLLNDKNIFNSVIDYLRIMCEFSIIEKDKYKSMKAIKSEKDILTLEEMTDDDIDRFKVSTYTVTGIGRPYGKEGNLLKRLTLNEIADISEFLMCSGICVPCSDIFDNNNKFESRINNEKLMLTFPWMITVFNDKYHEDLSSIRIEILLEYYISLALLETGYNVGTYRNSSMEEIDIVAINPYRRDDTIVVECKYANLDKWQKVKIKKYAIICANHGIDEFIITSIGNSRDEVFDINGNKIIAHIRNIPDLLFELSTKIYHKKLYNNNNDLTSFF